MSLLANFLFLVLLFIDSIASEKSGKYGYSASFGAVNNGQKGVQSFHILLSCHLCKYVDFERFTSALKYIDNGRYFQFDSTYVVITCLDI